MQSFPMSDASNSTDSNNNSFTDVNTFDSNSITNNQEEELSKNNSVDIASSVNDDDRLKKLLWT